MNDAAPATGTAADSPAVAALIRLAPLYAAEFGALVANGVAFTAIAGRAMAAGLDKSVVGAAGSAFYLGLFAIYLGGPAILARLGFRRAVLTAIAVAAGGTAALALAHPVFWFMGRFGTGLGIGLLYLAMETWISVTVPRRSRGTALSIYMAVFLAASLAGQAVLLIVPPASSTAIVIAGASLIAGFGFALAARPPGRPPDPAVRAGAGVAAIARAAPLGIVAVAVTGMAAGAFYALGPVYAASIGFAPESVAAFPLAVIAGAALAQALLGYAADRFGRRLLLAALTAASLAAGLALTAAGRVDLATLAMGALWGAAALTGYAPAAAIAYDAPHGRPPVEVARVVLTVNGLGGIFGPLLASALDPVATGKGCFVLATLVYCLLAAALVLARKPVPGRGQPA